MSVNVFLNSSNEFRKRDKCEGLPSIYHFFTISLINSIIQEHKCFVSLVRSLMSQLAAMVMLRRSVHLTTLFSLASLTNG